MPRQLPWLNKGGGGGSRTQVKQPLRRTERKPPSEIDDEFFAGTVLESTKTGKQRAKPRESDDELPELPTYIPRTPRKGKEPVRREDSSSPVPAADLPTPQVEYMRKAVDKYELRDDEWMMVEDEFLATAKLFTRHLHLAEYKQLKRKIEEAKKDIARPVIPNARPSIERQFKEKAKTQANTQKKAIKDLFTSDDHEENAASTSSRANSTRQLPPTLTKNRATSSLPSRSSHEPQSRPRPKRFSPVVSDSDDLDAPKKRPKSSKVASPEPSRNEIQPRPTSISTSLKKLPISTTSKARDATERPSRPTPFDMLDDFIPNRSLPPPKATKADTAYHAFSPTKATNSSISRTRPIQRARSPPKISQSSPSKFSQSTQKSRRTFDLFDELDFPTQDPPPKDQNERLTKHRAEREKEKEKDKKGSVKLDDIPTFLF